MLTIRNAVWIAKYLLIGALSTGCWAAAEVQIGENHKDVPHFSSRNLLDRDDIQRSTGSDSDTRAVLGLIGLLIMLGLAFCEVCMDCSCDGTRQGRVLQTPPRATETDVPPSYDYDLSYYLPSLKLGIVNSSSSLAPPTSSPSSSGTTLAPPRSSASIILPIEREIYPLHIYGIENPLYQPPSNVNPEQVTNVVPVPEQPRLNQTPLCEILDMPPSYTTVVKAEQKYPKPTGNS